MAPSPLCIIAMVALISGISSGDEGAFSFFQGEGEDIFTSSGTDPTQSPIINGIFGDGVDEISGLVDRIKDIPGEVVGAIFDGIIGVLNKITDLVVGIAGVFEEFAYDLIYPDDVKADTAGMMTAKLFSAFLGTLALFAIVRIWVWALNVVPVF